MTMPQFAVLSLQAFVSLKACNDGQSVIDVLFMDVFVLIL